LPVRVTLVLLATAAVLSVGGAMLIGRWAVGLVLIAAAGGVTWFALTRDVPDPAVVPGRPRVGRSPSEVLAEARDAA
jgi:hypothetical protein